MKSQLMNDKKSRIIFSSRISLHYEDSKLQEEYNEFLISSENILNKNIAVNIFCLIYFLIMLATSVFEFLEHGTEIIIYITGVVLEILILLILLLTKYKCYFKNSKNLQFFLIGINYFLLDISFCMIMIFTKNDDKNSEFILFIFTISLVVKGLYINIFISTYKSIFVGSIFSIFLQIIIFSKSNRWLTAYPEISNAIILIYFIVKSYLNELFHKLNFLRFSQLRDTINVNEDKQIFEEFCTVNLKNCVFSIDKTFQLSYANNSMGKLLNVLGYKTLPISSNLQIEKFKNNYNFNYNQLKLLFLNRSDYPITNNVNKNVNELRLKLFFIEELIGKLISVNADLYKTDKTLYDYLNKFIMTKDENDKKSKKFDFEEFLLIVYKSNVFLNRKYSIEYKQILQAESQPNYTSIINNTNIHNKESAILLDHRNVLLNLNDINDDQNKFTNHNFKDSHTDYIYLGKLYISNENSLEKQEKIFKCKNTKVENKELHLFMTILKSTEEVCFIIEDYSSFIEADRKETVKVCKSLYLSKISHELKNPISNILEISNDLNEEFRSFGSFKARGSTFINELKFKNTLMSDISICSSSEENSKNLLQTFDSKNSKIKNNLKFLKIISEMMLQIVKDFTFYSHAADDHLEKKETSNITSPYNAQNFNVRPIIINRETSNKTLFNDKICEYQEVIINLIEIFNARSALDEKSDKLSFSAKFEEQLPKFIQVDNEKFRSLVFNLLYHIYKSISYGTIVINVTIQNNLGRNSENKLLFEIQIFGSNNKAVILTNDLISEKDEDSVSINENIGDEKDIEINEIKNKSLELKSEISKFNIQSNPNFYDNSQLNSILNTSNLAQKNSIIDNFNNYFNFNVSVMYSKKLGIKMTFNNENSSMTKISFLCEFKNIKTQTNSTVKQSNNDSSLITLKIPDFPKRRSSIHSKSKIIITPKKNFLSSKDVTTDLNNKKGSKNRRNTVAALTLKNFQISESVNESSDASAATKQITHQNFFNYPHYITTNLNVFNMIKNNCQDSSSSSFPVLENIQNIENYDAYANLNNYQIQTDLTSKLNSLPKKKKNIAHSLTPSSEIQDLRYLTKSKGTLNFVRNETYKSNRSFRSYKTLKHSSVNLSLHFEESSKSISKEFTKILLCDDENMIRKTLNRFFDKFSENNPNLNFDVQHAPNGFECFNQIYNYFKQDKYFDILIIDETMPFMKGSEIIYLLKTMINEGRFKNLTIISFTSYDSPDKVEFLYSQGADFVLSKPMKYEEFVKFITNILRSKIDII